MQCLECNSKENQELVMVEQSHCNICICLQTQLCICHNILETFGSRAKYMVEILADNNSIYFLFEIF